MFMGCFLETVCALKVVLRASVGALWERLLWATLGPMLGEGAAGTTPTTSRVWMCVDVLGLV